MEYDDERGGEINDMSFACIMPPAVAMFKCLHSSSFLLVLLLSYSLTHLILSIPSVVLHKGIISSSSFPHPRSSSLFMGKNQPADWVRRLQERLIADASVFQSTHFVCRRREKEMMEIAVRVLHVYVNVPLPCNVLGERQ